METPPKAVFIYRFKVSLSSSFAPGVTQSNDDLATTSEWEVGTKERRKNKTDLSKERLQGKGDKRVKEALFILDLRRGGCVFGVITVKSLRLCFHDGF